MERNSMKKIKPSVTYETRYKHKLNMLEPGTALLKWSGLFLLVGLALRLLRPSLASYIAFGLAAALFLLLLILLVIEAHQDGVLNKIAAREKKES